MIDKKRFSLAAAAAAVLLLAVGLYFALSEKSFLFSYDNDKTVQQLVTTVYSADEIKEIEEKIEKGKTTVSKMKRFCKLECLRKTEKEYYSILLRDDGGKLFIFFDNKGTVTDYLFVTEFKSKEDYDSLKIGETTLNEVIFFDEATVDVSLSSFDVTVSVVKEGLAHIIYERMNMDNMTFLPSPVIKSITIYDESEYMQIAEQGDYYGELHYILPLDR